MNCPNCGRAMEDGTACIPSNAAGSGFFGVVLGFLLGSGVFEGGSACVSFLGRQQQKPELLMREDSVTARLCRACGWVAFKRDGSLR